MQPILTGVGRVPPQARGGCLACGRDIFVVGVGSPLVQSACVLIKPCFKRDGWGCFPTVSRLLRDSVRGGCGACTRWAASTGALRNLS
jgi:hypothetical protein